MSEAFEIIGTPHRSGILIVADHASNHVPADIDLGLEEDDLTNHIAWDIGVADVAKLIIQKGGFFGIFGGTSRLVADLNRYDHEEPVIPLISDGKAISGNIMDESERAQRLARFYHPYHQAVSELVKATCPALILSLHSFTGRLESGGQEQRPWEAGVMYNEQSRPSKMAIKLLRDAGLNVGDQKPYSGKLLNATMNKHAEAHNIPYFGCEMRQDLVAQVQGQARFATALTETCLKITEMLGAAAQNE